jgi:hypothetical protein
MPATAYSAIASVLPSPRDVVTTTELPHRSPMRNLLVARRSSGNGQPPRMIFASARRRTWSSPGQLGHALDVLAGWRAAAHLHHVLEKGELSQRDAQRVTERERADAVMGDWSVLAQRLAIAETRLA